MLPSPILPSIPSTPQYQPPSLLGLRRHKNCISLYYQDVLAETVTINFTIYDKQLEYAAQNEQDDQQGSALC